MPGVFRVLQPGDSRLRRTDTLGELDLRESCGLAHLAYQNGKVCLAAITFVRASKPWISFHPRSDVIALLVPFHIPASFKISCRAFSDSGYRFRYLSQIARSRSARAISAGGVRCVDF